MWSNIILNGNNKTLEDTGEYNKKSQGNCHPPSRYKHCCVLVPIHSEANGSSEPSSNTSPSSNNYDLYLYGGRSGTFPLKDFWKLDLKLGKWEEIKGLGKDGDDCWPPHLQEHSMVYYDRKIYVFGGEISFSYGEDLSPLWIYSLDTKTWRRWGLQTPEEKKLKQVKSPDLSRQTKTPVGRRGHTAVVWSNYMLVYGGYRDLKGSLGDLWAFHFDTESWHLFSSPDLNKKNSRPWYLFPTPLSSPLPFPRHSHAAALHGSSLYVHGGMQDLIELQDLWKFCLKTRKWTNLKAKYGPGPLHGHVGVAALDSLLIMSGERAGKAVDEFWRFDFLSEQWERIVLNGCRPCPRIWAWGGMLPMVLKRVNGRHSSNKSSSYKRYPGQFDDLEVCSSSTEADDGTKYWWDYDESQDTEGGNIAIHQATNIQIQVTNVPSNGNEGQPRKSSLFSELARFPFSSGGGDYHALSESNSVCLSEEETSPRPDGKDRSKWEPEIQFEPICPHLPVNSNDGETIKALTSAVMSVTEPLIHFEDGDNSTQSNGGGGDSSPEESSQVILEGSNSLITFDTPVSSRTTTYNSTRSSGVGTRPLSASNATRRSESANCLQLNNRGSKQSVKKSASVRFADIDENGRKANNIGGTINGHGAGCSGSSSQHQLILMRECTSDYSSMDNGLNYNQQHQNGNGHSSSGFENPNYRGSGSSTLFTGVNNGSSKQFGSKKEAESYEMGNMNPSAIQSTTTQSSTTPKTATDGNGVHFESSVQSVGSEEDSPTPYYFEVSTPNYMLLIGGNESHSSQVVSKRQPLSIWRLRVTSELFSVTTLTQGNSTGGNGSGGTKGPNFYPTYSTSVLSNSNSINRSMMKVNLSGPNHTTGF